jgi:hypothetical protein
MMNETEILEAVRAYIREHEHLDDWGVPCVYTDDLRKLIGMEPSEL